MLKAARFCLGAVMYCCSLPRRSEVLLDTAVCDQGSFVLLKVQLSTACLCQNAVKYYVALLLAIKAALSCLSTVMYCYLCQNAVKYCLALLLVMKAALFCVSAVKYCLPLPGRSGVLLGTAACDERSFVLLKCS